MKTLIFILILASFIQSSFLPLNLVLVILLARSLVVSGRENLVLAFFAGLLVGVLQTQNLGFWPLIFLLAVKLASLGKKLPISKNLITIFVISFVLVGLVNLTQMVFLKQTIDLKLVLIETILVLPVYLLMLFWQERFVVSSDNRLKLKN